MKVLILAGGFGTRLSEETDLIPKPLVKIGGKPILWHIMKLYSSFGYNEFIILLGYKGELIEEYFLNQLDLFNWDITFLDTGLKTDTGGRIRRAKNIRKHTHIYILYIYIYIIQNINKYIYIYIYIYSNICVPY